AQLGGGHPCAFDLADVAKAFQKAIDRIIEIKPDVILIGGDVFHAVRPTNPAILHAYTQFARLVESLPDAVIVMVAGNHDTPRTTETGWILRLFSSLGITVVEEGPKRLRFDGLSVLAVPSFSDIDPNSLRRDDTPGYQVLLMHNLLNEIAERIGPHAASPRNVSLSSIPLQDWDYVAMGHYHVYEKLAPNAFYSGSIEYTSTNIWGEVDEEHRRGIAGKGFIEHDLATGAHRFHVLPLARRVVDIRQIEGAGMTAAELSEAICAAVDGCEGGIDDRIVRLIVRDVPRHILRDLDHRKLREFKRRALNFLLDARRPGPVRLESAGGAAGKRASLAETVRQMLESRQVTPGIDRKSLVELGLFYLNEVDRLAPASSGDEA
ncbi:MAG: metallophosphoesterase family protein, partial [Gemmatimonadaceae bacterium]